MSDDPLALINVALACERVDARPFGWAFDGAGTPTEAKEWHTTCPSCSQRIAFTVFDMVGDRIKCTECGYGTREFSVEIEAARPESIIESLLIEPISAGLMDAP